jgi:hypothetical protein
MVVIGLMIAACAFGQDEPSHVMPVRSSRIELQYRLVDAPPGTRVALWYTRDRGATWERYGVSGAATPDARLLVLSRPGAATPDRSITGSSGSEGSTSSGLVFEAPAEGLYGFLLTLCKGEGPWPGPEPNTPPQQWVFIDYTPPLVQWDSVEPADTFGSQRVVQLRWTAHDSNLPKRPVALWYQSSVDQTWHAIEDAVANTGRYDWKVPGDLAGQITLRLAVRDLGGHVVERLYGPVPLNLWMQSAITVAPVTTRPGGPDASRPGQPDAGSPATRPADADLRKAEQLYREGSYYLLKGQYGLAADRLQKALEHDPALASALIDLAGICYLQEDYDRSAHYYERVLESNDQHAAALRGAALAYVAVRDYARSEEKLRRLVDLNDADAQAWLDLGDVMFLTGRQMEAQTDWQRALGALETGEKGKPADALLQKVRRRLSLANGPGAAPGSMAQRNESR